MSNVGLDLKTLFQGALPRFGERTAISWRGSTMTYRELASQSRRLAKAMTDLGIARGSTVAIAMSNRPEFLVADQAIILLGATKVPLNDMLAPGEVAFILEDADCELVICDPAQLPTILALRSTHCIIAIEAAEEAAIVDDRDDADRVLSWSEALGEDSDCSGEVGESVPGALGVILYTGGTTGRQKGVEHTQEALALNLLAHIVEIGLQDDERVLLTTPLAHSAGFIAQAALLKGATVFLEDGFDATTFIRRLTDDQITLAFMVPTMIYRVLDRLSGDSVEARDLALRTILYGAAPMNPNRLEEAIRRLGPVFMQLYGQSEAPNFLTRLRREDHDVSQPGLLASCGQPVPMVEILVRGANNEALPAGEVGEVVARSPYVMARYRKLPEKTAETLRGGWLHTGDLGYFDSQGYLFLVDRMNDVVISGGMNVYSIEVETAIASFAGVVQVAVFGVPHEDWGESVVACVVPASSEDFAHDDLREHCREILARYKYPKRIELVDSLPLTPYGKVDKKRLRREWSGAPALSPEVREDL